MDTSTIKPGVGVGDIHLDASREEIRELLGRPDSADTASDSDMWYYDSLNLSVLFQQDGEKWRLTEIDASDPDLRLGSLPLFGTPRDEGEALLAKAGLRGGTWSGEPAYETLAFAKERLIFGFFDGRLEEVMVSV